MGGRLLHEPCLHVTFSYLVTQATGESPALAGANPVLAMLLGGGLGRNTQIGELVRNMGSLADFKSCMHDDFKVRVDKGAEGFDNGFHLKVQEKMSDSVSLIVEQDSVIRVTTHSENAKNQLNAFIYQNNGGSDTLLASSKGSRTMKTLFHRAEPA